MAAVIFCLMAGQASAQTFQGYYTSGTITLGQRSTLVYQINNNSGGVASLDNTFAVIIANDAGGANAFPYATNCTATFTSYGGAVFTTWEISNLIIVPGGTCLIEFNVTPTIANTYPVLSPGSPQLSFNNFTYSTNVYAQGGGSAALQVNAPPLPTVTLLNPTTGSDSGGNTVTITGTNFTSPGNTNTVSFGASAATGVVYNSATSLTAVAPAGAVGTVNVTVTNANGTSVNNGALDDYTYTSPLPTVTLLNLT